MLNKVQLIGHMGGDPEMRYFQDGTAVASFSLATTERWKKDGEKKERTTWVRVEVIGKLAEVVQQYTGKGSKVYVEGKLRVDEVNKDGEKKFYTKVLLQGPGSTFLMLDGKERGASDDANRGRNPGTASAPADDFQVSDDDVPF